MASETIVSASRRALVVGCGMAGCAAAWWLEHEGWEVVLIDKVAEPYPRSYLLQLDAEAVRVLRLMGGQEIIDQVTFAAPAMSVRWGSRKVRELKIDGDDDWRLARRQVLLSRLFAHVPATVRTRLGVGLEALEHRSDDVLARFSDGSTEPFDVVVGADGLHSTVRRLTLASEARSVYRNGLTHVWINADVPLPDGRAVIASATCWPPSRRRWRGAPAAGGPFNGREPPTAVSSRGSRAYWSPSDAATAREREMGRTAGRGPADTKRLILDAARSVVVTLGARATLDDVAAAAGLTRGAVIYHYSSKNALWVALAQDVLAQFHQKVREHLEDGRAPGRLARAFICASLEGGEIEAVGERLFLLSALAVIPGVPELVAEDGSRWKAEMAEDGLSVGARTVILNAIDGAGLMTGWGLKPDRAELVALHTELENLTSPGS